jgi:hypothetical protein
MSSRLTPTKAKGFNNNKFKTGEKNASETSPETGE